MWLILHKMIKWPSTQFIQSAEKDHKKCPVFFYTPGLFTREFIISFWCFGGARLFWNKSLRRSPLLTSATPPKSHIDGAHLMLIRNVYAHTNKQNVSPKDTISKFCLNSSWFFPPKILRKIQLHSCKKKIVINFLDTEKCILVRFFWCLLNSGNIYVVSLFC